MTNGKTNLEYTVILNMYNLNNIVPKYAKQKLTKFLEKLDKYIIIVEDFNVARSLIDKSNG